MPNRFSFIFQVTTVPVDAAAAIPHTGGWTESFWRNDSAAIDDARVKNLASLRALMLPKQAAIVGWKRQSFTIDNFGVKGQGAATFKQRFPGNPLYNVNIPMDAMMFSGACSNGRNATRFTNRCLPDEVTVSGEFNGDAAFKTKMTNYGQALISDNWMALVRDLSQPTVKVLGITNKVVSVSSTTPFAIGLMATLLRVRDDVTNRPVTGSFEITALDSVAKTITLGQLSPSITSLMGGFARPFAINVQGFSSVNFARSIVRKVGAPFEKYRGRRSKRSVA